MATKSNSSRGKNASGSKRGLASASRETRERVSRLGGKSRKRSRSSL